MRQPYLYLDGRTPVLMISGQGYRLSKKELESLYHDITQAETFLNQKSKAQKYKEIENVGHAS